MQPIKLWLSPGDLCHFTASDWIAPPPGFNVHNFTVAGSVAKLLLIAGERTK
jgi:hypothetical protein